VIAEMKIAVPAEGVIRNSPKPASLG